MSDQELLIRLYEIIITTAELSESVLLANGINHEMIKKLVNDNVLSQNSSNIYKLVSVEGLFQYSIYLTNQLLLDRAIQCLRMCHKLDPTNREVSLQMIYLCIKNQKIDNAFEAFKWIDNAKDKTLQKDNNLILYLLSLICDYPDEYRERVIKMEYSDVTLTNSESQIHHNIASQNKMRISILINEISTASHIFEYTLKHDATNLTEKDLLKELLHQAKEAESQKIATLLSLVEHKDYDGIVSLIEKQRHKNKISLYYKFIYYIAKKITIIKKTQTIPQIKVDSTNSLNEALLGENYQLALKINCERDPLTGGMKEKNIITSLLKEINDIINKLKQEQAHKTILFRSMILSITENNAEAINSLKDYLKTINKSKYESLIFNFIKLDILERDEEFSNVVNILLHIGNPSYKFNVEFYINKFNDSINQNNFDIARIYLDIILKAISLSENLKSNPELQEKIDSMSSLLEESIEERNTLLGYIEPLKKSEDSTIILSEISDEQKQRTINIIPSIPELSIFYIGEESKTPVLRYIDNTNQEDKNILYPEGLKAYYEGNYQLSITIYSKLIKIAKEVRPKLFAMLGLSYLQLGNKELAIKYLTIATELNKVSKKINRCYKFNKLIQCIKTESDENQEREIQTHIARFNSSITNYDMYMLESLASYIKQSNIPLTEAAISFKFNQNHIYMIKLIYAKEYYAKGDYASGDALYQEVEASPNKGINVKTLLGKIKKLQKLT